MSGHRLHDGSENLPTKGVSEKHRKIIEQIHCGDEGSQVAAIGSSNRRLPWISRYVQFQMRQMYMDVSVWYPEQKASFKGTGNGILGLEVLIHLLVAKFIIATQKTIMTFPDASWS